jgi:hypothetical protein
MSDYERRLEDARREHAEAFAAYIARLAELERMKREEGHKAFLSVREANERIGALLLEKMKA